MAQVTEHVEFYETAGGRVVACVYVKDAGLVNIVGSFNSCTPLPRCTIISAAKEGFPFASEYDPAAFEGKTMQQLETDVVQLDRHIATIYGPAGGDKTTAVYPEKCTPAGRMFVIRWFY